jgi:hypothetical protein
VRATCTRARKHRQMWPGASGWIAHSPPITGGVEKALPSLVAPAMVCLGVAWGIFFPLRRDPGLETAWL